jgi:hypothetical protein
MAWVPPGDGPALDGRPGGATIRPVWDRSAIKRFLLTFAFVFTVQIVLLVLLRS